MRYQVHGWPFVYMVRETHVGGELHNILNGPWPLFSPPLVSFWPMWLLLDVLCGIVLMGLAAAIALYWLRVRRRPLQFGLRNLFLFVTVVACLLGLFKFFNPGFGETFGLWFTIAWCMLLLAQILVYIVPVAFVVTVAHWAVGISAGWQRRRPWAGIHWLTWLAVVVAGIPIVHYSAFAHASYGGWPFTFDENCLDAAALIADILVWLALIAATGFVVERWIRRAERMVPMRPASFLAAVVAVVVACIVCTITLEECRQPEWYDYYSWFFGTVFTVFTIEVAVVAGTKRFVGRLREWMR
jgi:hypothetical protein